MSDTSADYGVAPEVLGAALDEIYRLRQLAAYTAAGLEATLDYRSFPKSRRAVTEQQIERLKMAAQGRTEVAVAGINHQSLRSCMERAGAALTLTRYEWEQGLRNGRSKD